MPPARPPRPPRPRRPLLLAFGVLAALGGACGGGDASARGAPAAGAPAVSAPAGLDTVALAQAYAQAARLPKLRSLLVQRHDTLVGERYFGGARADRPANIKSASKSVVSALVGVAIADGALRDVRQTVGELLPADTRALDSAKRAITVEDLLTMRSGLESTSIGNYGAWVSSRDWVRYALARPLVAPAGHDGGPMIYSTGNTHLLSAALTRARRESLYAQWARELARPLGIVPRPWTTDPRGIYFGGNEMRMTPREMVRFGALYLHGGAAPPGTPAAGRQVIPRAWIDSSWVPRTASGWSGHEYGYGWWRRTAAGPRGAHVVHFAWGYGGQFIFVVPDLGLVVVATSDADAPERDGSHLGAVHALLDAVVAAAGG